jgi:hypothetical protein
VRPSVRAPRCLVGSLLVKTLHGYSTGTSGGTRSITSEVIAGR